MLEKDSQHNTTDSPRQVILVSAMGEFYPFKGGIAQYALGIAQALVRHNDVHVLAPHGPLKKPADTTCMSRPRITGIPWLRFLLGNIVTMWNTLTHKPNHIIITHPLDLQLHKLVLHTKALLFPNVKISYVVYGTEIHDIAEGTGMLDKDTFKKLISNIDTIVAISRFTKKLFTKYFPDVNTPIDILYPTLTKSYVAKHVSDGSLAQTLRSYNLQNDKYVLSVGRLYKRKGHELIIKEFASLLSKFPHLKYVIVGDGPEEKRLQKLIHEKGLDKNIVLTGSVNEKTKIALIKGSAFYIHPSIHIEQQHQAIEGFGIAILEAMFHKKPAIVFDHGGMVEIVEDKKNGFIIPESDKKAFVDKIQYLLSHPDQREKLGNNAQKTYAKLFSIESFQQTAQKIFTPHTSLKRPRVTFIVEWFYPVIGGAGVQAERLAHELHEFADVNIVTKSVQNAPQKETHNDIHVQRIGNESQGRIGDYTTAWKLFIELVKNRHNIDMLHIHGNLENNFPSAATLFAKLFNRPIIGKLSIAGEMLKHVESQHYSALQLLMKNLNVLNLFRRWLAKQYNYYIAISKDIEKELHNVGIDKNRIVSIPNGVNIDTFTPPTSTQRKNTRRKLKLTDTKNVYLVVSRLAQHKGIISPLLEAWQIITANKKSDNDVLIIVGSGEGLSSSIEQEVQTYVKKNSILNVRLEGRQENVLPYYHAADVYISPSENEGLSNSLLEAGACGLYCIVRNVSGNTDIILNNKTGRVFENKKQLADILQEIQSSELKNTTTAKKILRKHIMTNYSLKQTASEVIDIYKRCLSTGI